ncbi:hypothetical protein CCR75_005512 [Bremia lactucae]|uniref:Uncharacterized protein n=1 Tax=Bremia lactucae TaxID=4779 RepID=A0A976NZ70_BRELC|nr:hypothetical protein CCR75_004525 [Bremia lactucae]TDH73361.1 hypothetical protein CCR75_005512 [Bremia lactucae]
MAVLSFGVDLKTHLGDRVFKERVEYRPVVLVDHLRECRAICRQGCQTRKMTAQLGRNASVLCGVLTHDGLDLGLL